MARQSLRPQLNQIRIIVMVNLSLGVLVVIIAAAGRYWP